jgi:two-component sensor histidine kinase
VLAAGGIKAGVAQPRLPAGNEDIAVDPGASQRRHDVGRDQPAILVQEFVASRRRPLLHCRLRWRRRDWQEWGGPAVVAPPTQGFGLKLVVNEATYTLAGHLELNFEPEGLTAVLTCKL